MPFIELVAQRRPPTAPPGMTPPENAKDWFRMEATPDEEDSTDIYVYESIGGWFGMWADDFIAELKQVSTKNINLRLNSPGGSVFDGIAIANAIRSHPANVTVYVDSLAASIASVIALAGNRIVMMPQSQFMVHNASGGCYGDATEMTKMADLLDKQSRNIAEAYAQHTGRPVAEWQDYMAAETWFTAEEAVAVGLADEAMPMRPKKGEDAEEPASAMANMARSWDLSMYTYAGRENAPAPVIAAEVPLVVAGARLTAEMVNGLQPTAGLVASSGTVSDMSRDELAALIRETVRAELAVVEGTACPSHSTAVKDGTWDAGANEGHLPSPVPLATVKKMYAYYDEDKVEDGDAPKSACKLPHHFVGSDGTPGAASINGVRNALARLPQTQGLTDAERKAAEAHLRGHLNAYSGDEEDHVHEEADAHTHVHEEVEDAQAPAPEEEPDTEPDEDDDPGNEAPPEASDDGTPPSEHPVDTGLGNAGDTVESTETYDADDAWQGLVDRLLTPPSSADDVFNTLKEEW